MSERVPPATPTAWENTWLAAADIMSRRSKDPDTQHGAVLVDRRTNRRVGDGYNGPPPGVDDRLLHFGREPYNGITKYDIMRHAEINALDYGKRAAGLVGVTGCVLFVTGPPCSRCALEIVASDVRHVVFGCRGSRCVDTVDWNKTVYLFQTWGVLACQWIDGRAVPCVGPLLGHTVTPVIRPGA